MPGKAVIHYAIPMAADSNTPGGDSEEVVLSSSGRSATDGVQ